MSTMRRCHLIPLLLILTLTPLWASVCQQSTNITGDILTCKRLINTLNPNSDRAISGSLELVELYRKAGDLKLANTVLEQLLNQTLSEQQKYDVLRQKGINAYRQRNYIQALDYFHDTQQMALQLEVLSLQGKSANDLANVYQALGDLDSALTLLLQSYQIAKQLNDNHRQAIILNNLGNVSRDINQLDDAIVSFRQAHLLHQQAGDFIKANHSLLSLAEVLFKQRQFNKASAMINDVIDALIQSGSHAQVSRAYLLLVEIAIVQNDTKQAAQWLNAQKRTRKLVQNSQIDQRALLVEAKLKQLEGEHMTAQTLLKQGLSSHSQQNSQLTELFYIALIQSQQQAHQYKDAVNTLTHYNSMLRSSRSQSEKLYKFRMQRADILSPNTKSSEPILTAIFAAIIFSLGGLAASAYFKIFSSKTTQLRDNIKHDNALLIAQQTRLLMVEIMTLSLSIWEQCTGKSRIELAEESKVWKVNIDDGRLRVRTFERYLNIKTLPKKPRRRNIISTANHVVIHANNDHPQLQLLINKIAQLEAITMQQKEL
jgi:tetratricopeptide (TPR) repeat protein